MNQIIEHTSRKREYTEGSKSHSYTILGSCDEIFALQDDTYAIGKYIPGMGRIKSSNLSQKGGSIWALELVCAVENGSYTVTQPDTGWGEKSASLDGSMLSLPLETAEGYRTNWNHYLFAHPEIDTLPVWWQTARDPILDDKQAQCYAWGMTINDVPVIHGMKWKILANPTKPGVNSRDIGVYTVTESAKFTSAEKAGEMVANKLNKIGAPCITFGITGGDWKCDHATIAFQQDKWVATLTWTRSGDDTGWDRDLYYV